MIRLTFFQMRRSIGRLAAAGIAIAIGTGFVAVTLLGGNVITRTAYNAIAASFADADVIVSVNTTPERLAAIESVPGVDAALPETGTYLELVGSKTSSYQYAIAASPNERLNSQVPIEGRLPTSDNEIALPTDLSTRIDAKIGTVVSVPVSDEYDDEGNLLATTAPDKELTVVGLLDDPYSAFTMFGGAAVVSQVDLAAMSGAGATMDSNRIAVALTPGTSVPQAIDAISAALATPEANAGSGQSGEPDAIVRTKDEEAALTAADFTGGEDILTSVVLGFAGLALLVAGLVIANTFQVLVAQRTRTLAMLRCVGANKKQLRQSVLLEASILGVVASVVGIALGSTVGQIALTVASNLDLGVPLPTSITMTPAVIIAPILAGAGVTVIAAFAPARAATRVSPLAAMRPAESPSVTSGSKGRLILASVLALLGFGLLGLGIMIGVNDQAEVGLLLGLAGGALSFVGVVVGAVFWIPAVTGLVGKLIARTGPSGKLAAANTVRNPRRTAATSTALLIGVTLVVMMSTGAISARHTLTNGLNGQYPVDVSVQSGDLYSHEGPSTLSPAVANETLAIDGVRHVLRVPSANLGWKDFSTGVSAVDPEMGKQVLSDSAWLDSLADDVLVLSASYAADFRLEDGDTINLYAVTDDLDISAETVPSDVPTTPVTIRIADIPSMVVGPVLTPATMEKIKPDAMSLTMWIALEKSADPLKTTDAIQGLFDGTQAYVTGDAVERAMFQNIIDTLLAIVVGLLAVAVIIALIGVANTLSLSVIERQRENAMLRAIGLSKRQLRRTLAIEGVLIATVGTALGALLGLGYGWAGSLTILSVMGDVTLSVPWRDLALVLGVALLAGLLASVIPARRAVRTSPVEALAVD